MSDPIDRQAAIELVEDLETMRLKGEIDLTYPKLIKGLNALPSAQPEGYIKIPETGIDDLSDGFHTFRQLYYQRMMLFAAIVKQNKDKAWKSLRHEDGELCFGGGWFIVGIDTPEGSYTYHYEDNYFSLFDCEELEHGKHWDGHTEKDVTRLLSLPSAQTEQQWIPVTERLPERCLHSHVLVTDLDMVGEAYYNSDGRWFDLLGNTLKDVTAWMPLPEPYRKEADHAQLD